MTIERAVASLGRDAPAAIDAALARRRWELSPVPPAGPERRDWEAALDERLRQLAVKVLPTAAPAQTRPWRAAMVLALSDLPAMVALTAAKRAIHRSFRFIGEIEAAVRDIAAAMIAERHADIRHLSWVKPRVEAALAGASPAPAPKPDRPPPTADDVAALNAMMVAIGSRRRFGLDGSTYFADGAA